MRRRACQITWIVPLAATLGLAGAACATPERVYDDDPTSSVTTTSSGLGGAGTGGTTGGTSTSTTSSGTGGTGGGTQTLVGHDATEFVSGGLVASNGQHRMVFTVGQPGRAQGAMTNANHRLEGGLVGAMETMP